MLEKVVHQRTRALRNANTELQTEITRRKGLEGQILEISDREQEKLGQELHDGLCQQLTAIGFLARATALRLKDHRVVQTEDLEKIAQLINRSVMDARNIARDLHKEEINAADFPVALQNLMQRKVWKTPCRLELKTEVNLEDDEKRTSKVLPMAKRYGAAVIALTIDEAGMALTADKKVEIAKRIHRLATEKYGIRESDGEPAPAPRELTPVP